MKHTITTDKYYSIILISISSYFISMMIVAEYHNLLLSLGFIILLTFLLIKRFSIGVNFYIVGSYLFPFISKLIYAYQREIYIKDFLKSLPDWLGALPVC